MPDEALQNIIASVRQRLSEELEAQLRVVHDQHEQALAEARSAAAAEARAQALQQSAAELDRVRAEAEHRLADEIARVRTEGEQRAAEAAAQTRQQLEQALATERQLAQARLDAERQRAADPLLEGFRRVDEAASVSDTLAAMVRAAAAAAGSRVALLIANDQHLDEWTVPDIEPLRLGHDRTSGGIFAEALTTKTPARGNDGAAIAVPILLDGTPVGLLYAEKSSGADHEWPQALEALARHGAAHLGYLTALRTAQARQWLSTSTAAGGATPGVPQAYEDGDAAARRYARLLVSEIKLYNEAAVATGRERGDLLQRLAPDIERARRLYEEHVPAAVPQRARHFHDELVQTLAGGDPSRLG